MIEVARRYFLKFGTLPLTLFAELVRRGYVVSELEKQWEKERNG